MAIDLGVAEMAGLIVFASFLVAIGLGILIGSSLCLFLEKRKSEKSYLKSLLCDCKVSRKRMYAFGFEVRVCTACGQVSLWRVISFPTFEGMWQKKYIKGIIDGRKPEEEQEV